MDASSPENKAPLRKEVSDSIDALISLLKSQLHLTSLILAILSKQDFAKGLKTSPTEVGGDIALSLVNLYLAMGISANSFVTLAKTPGLPTRDCYTIARSVLETAVNICFIIARGKEAARQAIAHSRQKAYRDMDRESRIGESVIKVFVTDKPDPQLIKGISGDLAKFTTKGGGEKRDWVDLSIDQRIESASKELGGSLLVKLHFARFVIYRHSSEIIHGTLFGALFFMGITSPNYRDGQSLEEFSEKIGHQSILLLLALNLTISAVVEAFHNRYGFPDGYEKTKEYLANLSKVPWFVEIRKR